MRLTRIELQNFKACRSVDIELAPLTVLIGANNAGKSSILHSIALAAQSVAAGRLTPAGSLVDLGQSLSGLVHRDGHGDARLPAVSDLTWSEAGPEGPIVRATTGIGIDGRGAAALNVNLTWRGQQASLSASADGTVNVEALDIVTQVKGTQAPLWNWRLGSYPATAAIHSVLAQANPFLQSFAAVALRRFRYVGANRHVDSSVFPLGTQPVVNPRTAQELLDTLAYEDELLRRVSQRCESIFGYGVDKDLIPGQQITIVATNTGTRRNVVNLGTGFIQAVWLLTQLELALAQPPGEQEWSITPLAGIEEPELHIHPGRQPDIARVLGTFVRAGVDVICTTQSEHLLLALLSLVLEGELAASDIVVYYLSDGEAERLAVDEQGRIEGGLRGFFEANEEQLRRHIELLKQRG